MSLQQPHADKRDEAWSQWSDREIARQCGVSHMTVGRIREDLSLAQSDSQPAKRTSLRENRSDAEKPAKRTSLGKIPSHSLPSAPHCVNHTVSPPSAPHCGNSAVTACRAHLTGNGCQSEPATRTYTTRHGTKAQMNVGGIGGNGDQP